MQGLFEESRFFSHCCIGSLWGETCCWHTAFRILEETAW